MPEQAWGSGCTARNGCWGLCSDGKSLHLGRAGQAVGLHVDAGCKSRQWAGKAALQADTVDSLQGTLHQAAERAAEWL